jgi:mannosyltransferase
MIVPNGPERGLPFYKSRKILTRLLLIIIVLLGFGLRLHDLEGQSMWSDEGLSLYRASLSLPEIVANVITVDGIDTQDTNPPFYFLFLHLFKMLAGDTIFSLRFGGAAIATLAVPLIYVMGAVTFRRRVGLVAALLMAISPFHVWQSQVLRNYGILITINMLSVYGLLRFALAKPGGDRRKWLLLWAGAGLLGIYTHYFGFFIFSYGLITLGVITIRQWDLGQLARKRQFWLAVGLGILILLPAVIVGLNRFAAGQQVDFSQVPLLKVLNHAASAFSVGVNWTLTHPWWRVLPVALVALVGLWFGWKRRPKAAALLVGYQIVPLALLLTISLINPLYNGVRHLLIGLPPFLLFVAAGIIGPFQLDANNETTLKLRNLWRVLGPVLALLILASQLSWLDEQFTSPTLVRDDVRGAAVFLNEHASPNDIVLLHDALIKFTFNYYYEGDAPVVAMPEYGDRDSESVIETLQKVTEGKDRVWFLTEPTPRTSFDIQALPDWIERNWLYVYGETFPAMWLRVRLEGYDLPTIVHIPPESATTVDVFWDYTLRLHAFDIPPVATSGSTWLMNFYLSQPTAQPKPHTLSLRLVDAKGQVWSQIDRIINHTFPPASTLPDTLMQYKHRVMLPPGIPPGEYELRLSLIRTTDGYVVPTSTGDLDLFLSDVTVTSASCNEGEESLVVDGSQSAKFGNEIELKGYSRPIGEFRPGDLVTLDLLWCANKQPQSDYHWRLQLADESGQVVDQVTGPLSTVDYPSGSWEADELIMGQANIVVPAQLEAGTYDLTLSVLRPDAEEALPVNWPFGRRQIHLGSIDVGN